MSDDILAIIDGALADYRMSTDAMRWTAAPPQLRSPVDPTALTFTFTVDLRAVVAPYVSAMRSLGEALKAGPKPLHLLNVAFLFQRSPREYHRHRKNCRTCNPAGNPAPLRIDGHAYQRRRKARQRRDRG